MSGSTHVQRRISLTQPIAPPAKKRILIKSSQLALRSLFRGSQMVTAAAATAETVFTKERFEALRKMVDMEAISDRNKCEIYWYDHV